MVTNLSKRLSKRAYIMLGSLLIFALLPLAIGDDRSLMHLLIMSFIWATVAASWDLIMGYARVYDFAHLAFFGFGGYTSAMLTVHFGISPWLGILAGGGLTLALSLLIALPCLRLRGMYVGMVTFAVALILPQLARAGIAIGTGGSWGLTNLPPLHVGGYTFTVPELVPWYYVALAMFAGFGFAIYKIINSPIGLAFVALRDSEPFAKTLGVNDYRFMFIMFGISAFIAGVAGAFYSHYIGVIDPGIFNLSNFLFGFVILMLGGLASFPGAVIAAFPLVFLNNALLPLLELRLVILGAIILGVMIFLPRGIMEIPEAINRLIRQRAIKKQSG